MSAEAAHHGVLESLRHYVVSYQTSVQQLARWMDLPLTDGNALGEVMWAASVSAPLSPTDLVVRTGLTSGAVNALVNRLEARGLATRSREHTDRRVVTLRPTDTALTRARPFLQESSARLETALADYDTATLDLIQEFLERFARILPTHG